MAVGNLEFIKSEIVSSSVTTVTIDNVFSDKYSSYMFVTSKSNTVGTSATGSSVRAITGGSADTGSNYDYAGLDLKAETSFGQGRNTNQTSMIYLFPDADADPESGGTVFYVHNPYDSSSYTFFQSQTVQNINGVHRGRKAIQVYKQANTVTGIEVTYTHSINQLTVSVYGVK